jgi:hypothetical protein
VNDFFHALFSHSGTLAGCSVMEYFENYKEFYSFSCMDMNKTNTYGRIEEFNRYLEELCVKNDITFISIFYKMTDENNITIPEYLDNWEGSHMHLSQTAMPLIIDAFKDKNLI